MQRVFIAIDISDEARAIAAEYIETLRRDFPEVRVGWERPEKLHFTLKFLGNADDATLAEVKELVRSAAASMKSIPLELAGTGVFPNPRNPRILWLGLKEDGETMALLAGTIETDCDKLGFVKEKRSFKSHLTIARIREPQKARKLAERHAENGFGPILFVAHEVAIYKSELRPTGSVYTKLAVFPMKTGE